MFLNRLVCFVAMLAVFCLAINANIASAQTDVTVPGDPVIRVDGNNGGGPSSGVGGTSPAGETEINVIDNTTSKYFNWLDFDSGIIVTPAVGRTVMKGLRLYTANDIPNRDPATYSFEGSNAGSGGPWTLISQGPLALPAGRNPAGSPIALTQFHQEISFVNTIPYTSYRLKFPTIKAAAVGVQIGEVEFLGVRFTAGPTSSVWGLLIFMLLLMPLGVAGYRMRIKT